jgi:preprotein translocase subunit SecY
MASQAEQLASSINLANFSKATELKKRLWFTLGVLVLFRFLSFVPIPGLDPAAMAALFETQSGGVLDIFNTFSGGALERMSVIALGLMPYITASIVVQLMGSMYEPWKQLKKEGEAGRKKLNQYTRYLTVLLVLVQGYMVVRGLQAQSVRQGIPGGRRAGARVRNRRHHLADRRHLVPDVARRADHQPRHRQRHFADHHGRYRRHLPQALVSCSKAAAPGTMDPLLIMTIVVIALSLIGFICFMERAQRRVLVQYPKRQTARGLMQQDRSHLPIKLNTAGVIPPIFASALLLMPLTVIQWAGTGAGPTPARATG